MAITSCSATRHASADEAILLRSVLETRHVDAHPRPRRHGRPAATHRRARGDHVPVVALWQGSASHGLAMVSVDNAHGISEALDHLLALGTSTYRLRQWSPARRHRGAFGRLRARGCGRRAWTFLPGYVQHVSNEPAGGEQAPTALMELPVPPTAIVLLDGPAGDRRPPRAAIRGLGRPRRAVRGRLRRPTHLGLSPSRRSPPSACPSRRWRPRRSRWRSRDAQTRRIGDGRGVAP